MGWRTSLYKYPMRKWIEIVENVRRMEPRDYSVYSGVTIDHDPENASLDIQGDHRDKMNTQQAKDYLDQHPNGTIHNDIFNTDSFITLDKNGNYLFYHGVDNKIMPWDWSEAEEMIENDQDRAYMEDWWYHPGAEMDVTNGGHKWWSDLRSGEHSTPKPKLS